MYKIRYRRGEAFLTDATGRLTLRWEGADGISRTVPVDLPKAEGAEVRVDETRARPVPGPVRLAALTPGEARPKEGSWETAHPGDVVEFQPEGWRRLRAVAPTDGETILRWGTSTLRLLISPEIDSLVLVGGEVYEVPKGRLELRGFMPGPLRVVVAPRDTADSGVELQVELKPGVVTEKTVEL